MTLPLRIPAGPLRLRRHFLTIVLCLLLGTGMAALVIMRERDRLVAEHGARLAATAGLLAERLDQGLNAWARDVLLLARFAAFKQSPADPVALRRLMEDLRSRAPEFAWIGLAATDGRVVAATGGVLEGRSVADRSWFAGGLRGLYVGEVNPAVLLSRLSPDVSGGEPAAFLSAAAPVFSEDGRNLGVLAAQLNWRWAEQARQETLRQFADRDVPDLLVVSPDGRVLLGPENQLGRRIEGVAPPSATGWAEDGTGILTGQARIHGAPQYLSTGWMVMARGDSAAVLAPLWPLAWWLALGPLGIAVLGRLLAPGLTSFLGGAAGSAGRHGTGADTSGRIADMAATLKRLREPALRDPLTGLLNGAGFATWREAHRDAERGCALLALQLNGVEAISDRLGHAAGDAALAAIGRWLEGGLRIGDCAMRRDVNAFLVCLRAPPEMVETAAVEVATRLQAALAAGLPTAFGAMAMACDIGIALVPRDAPDLDRGITQADRELERVKRLRQRSQPAG